MKNFFLVLQKNLKRLGKQKGFTVSVLGNVGLPIYFLNREENDENSNVLIATGFHGDEVAPVWSILVFLEKVSEKLLSNVNVSILPLVNPTGFVRGTRVDKYGFDTNRGYTTALNIVDFMKPLSPEGEILKNYKELLFNSSRDGVLCLHEISRNNFVLYDYEKDNKIGTLTKEILKTGEKYFGIETEDFDKRGKFKDGIITENYDGSFQDWLFREGPCKVAIVTETPIPFPFMLRVKVNYELIQKFVDFFSRSKKDEETSF